VGAEFTPLTPEVRDGREKKKRDFLYAPNWNDTLQEDEQHEHEEGCPCGPLIVSGRGNREKFQMPLKSIGR